MAYERLNLTDGTILTAQHMAHIEDGLANSMQPEGGIKAETSRNILKNSLDYWYPYYNDPLSIKSAQQNFMTGDQVSELALIVPPIPNRVASNYLTSPVIRIDSSYENILTIKNSAITIRHFLVYNGKGERLFCGGCNAGYPFPTGLNQANLTVFAQDSANQIRYPNLCKNFTYNNFYLDASTLKELNRLQLSFTETNIGTYIPGEVVWIVAVIAAGATRPTEETALVKWTQKVANNTVLTENIYKEGYTLAQLAVNPTMAKKYYSTPFLDDVAAELGEFKQTLAVDTKATNVVTTKIEYNVGTTPNLFPAQYEGWYTTGSTHIDDFETPTYSKITNQGSGMNYRMTCPIPVDFTQTGNYELVSGQSRSYGLFDEGGNILYYYQPSAAFTTLKLNYTYIQELGLDPETVKWIVLTQNINQSQSTWNFSYIDRKTSVTFEMPNLRLTEQQVPALDIVNNQYKTVNLFNVDRIVSIGDSYTESHYTIKDKSWMSKVSLLTDYNYDNFALSGDTYRGQLNKIRKGQYAYATSSGMTWEKLNPTHTIMICKTNDTKYMDCQQFIYDMAAAIETTKGMGAIPIIATEYHVVNHDFIQTAFNSYAKRYGGYYVDLTEKVYTLRGTDYAPFWGGSHPGTRPNHMFSDTFINYINKNLPRPYSAIKIFRPRDNSSIGNLDAYLFSTREERAEKFKEISICHSALKDSSDYDNCTDKSNGKVESEYFKLMSGIPVTFNNICLIDVILPSTVHDIKEITLLTNELSDVDCYVRDVLAEPYPTPDFCRRFDIAQVLTNEQVAIGNKYRSSSRSEDTYTVKEILYDKVESANGFVDGTVLICSGNRVTSAYNNTTLTLLSGTGEATLHCTYEAVGFSSDYPSGKQDIGHYVLLEQYGLIDEELVKRVVDNDRVTFLLVKNGDFSLTNVGVQFKGNITKQRDTFKYCDTLNQRNSEYNSILPVTTFNSSNIGSWLNNTTLTSCSKTPEIPADKCMPTGISQIITINPGDDILVQRIPLNNSTGRTANITHKVRVWARYFPDIFDKETMVYPDEAPINDNSFDWAKLGLKLYDTQSNAKNDNSVLLTELVGLHWTEIELDLTFPSVVKNKDWYIGLQAVDKPIQLAYCDII